jgi:L-threonylcarbamoyladenylate synthase
VSPTTAQHVREELGDEVDLILDGGPCAVGIESTVLDLSGDVPHILRPGAITRERIEQVLQVSVDHMQFATEVASPAKSPGMHQQHYAPRTPAYRVDPSQIDQLDLRDAALLSLAADAQAYARQFYAALRRLDAQDHRAIYIVMPPDRPEWTALRDRITRATRPLSDDPHV